MRSKQLGRTFVTFAASALMTGTAFAENASDAALDSPYRLAPSTGANTQPGMQSETASGGVTGRVESDTQNRNPQSPDMQRPLGGSTEGDEDARRARELDERNGQAERRMPRRDDRS